MRSPSPSRLVHQEMISRVSRRILSRLQLRLGTTEAGCVHCDGGRVPTHQTSITCKMLWSFKSLCDQDVHTPPSMKGSDRENTDDNHGWTLWEKKQTLLILICHHYILKKGSSFYLLIEHHTKGCFKDISRIHMIHKFRLNHKTFRNIELQLIVAGGAVGFSRDLN